MAVAAPHKAGNVETNPGLTTLNKRAWIRDICYKQIHVMKKISIRCNRIDHWVYFRCAGNTQIPRPAIYTGNPDSQLTTHTDITPTHPSRPWSKSPTHSPPTPHTPPQQKYRHTSNTLPVPTGLVKPKPNPLFHSPPSPPTPSRSKHIHISQAPPTPLIPRTTLIHNTSVALDTIPEPRVPPTCPALTTPHPSPTPALLSTSHHHTLSADAHET